LNEKGEAGMETRRLEYEDWIQKSDDDLRRELREIIRYEPAGRGDHLVNVLNHNRPLVEQALDYRDRVRRRRDAQSRDRVRWRARTRPLYELASREVVDLCARQLGDLFGRKLTPAELAFIIEKVVEHRDRSERRATADA
jgi:hypothetical protein